MKTRWSHVGCLVAAISLPLACPAAGQSVGTAAKHALWQVEGVSHTVHLLGSFHLLKPDNYPLAAPMEAAFSNAQIVVFETDMDEMARPGVQAHLRRMGALPPGETLAQFLSTDTYANVHAYVRNAGLSGTELDRLRPFMAAMMLSMLELQRLGYRPTDGVDVHFFELARESGKKMASLESVDFQIELLASFPDEDGEALVKSTLKDLGTLDTMLADMIQAWQTGDSEQLQKLVNDNLQEFPELDKRMLTDRNKRWVPKIEELLRGSESAIVIVGAGHLVGPEGVVELLRRNGWNVTQR